MMVGFGVGFGVVSGGMLDRNDFIGIGMRRLERSPARESGYSIRNEETSSQHLTN